MNTKQYGYREFDIIESQLVSKNLIYILFLANPLHTNCCSYVDIAQDNW